MYLVLKQFLLACLIHVKGFVGIGDIIIYYYGKILRYPLVSVCSVYDKVVCAHILLQDKLIAIIVCQNILAVALVCAIFV